MAMTRKIRRTDYPKGFEDSVDKTSTMTDGEQSAGQDAGEHLGVVNNNSEEVGGVQIQRMTLTPLHLSQQGSSSQWPGGASATPALHLTQR